LNQFRINSRSLDPNTKQPEPAKPNPSEELILTQNKKKQSKLDKLANPDLPLEAKEKLLENPQLLELSIDPRNESDR
jgi:hypothetical protein